MKTGTTKKLRLERRTANGRLHVTHLKRNCIMHLDIIEALTERAIKNNVRLELVESVFEGGYIRED